MSGIKPPTATIANALNCQCEPMWSKLSGGRSNRLWRRQCACGDFTVKEYDPQSHSALFRNDPAAEWFILHHLQDRAIAPRPCFSTYTPTGKTVALFEYIDACRWQKDLHAVASLLLALRDVPKCDLPERTIGSHALEMIAQELLKPLEPELRDAHIRRKPHQKITQIAPLGLVHGDFTPANILQCPQGAVAIDWQSPWWGDPIFDVGIFLSPSMQHHSLGHLISRQDTDGFFRALHTTDLEERYEMLQPWFAWVMAAYGLWRTHVKSDPSGLVGYALEMEILNSARSSYL